MPVLRCRLRVVLRLLLRLSIELALSGVLRLAPAVFASSALPAADDVQRPLSVAEIRGSRSLSPYAGRAVSTSGVVTDIEDDGFHLQDPDCDARDGRPCAVFVYTANAPHVRAGQRLLVSARVRQYTPGHRTFDPLETGQTELAEVRQARVTGTGTVTPRALHWPPGSAQAMFPYDGMLVTVRDSFTVQDAHAWMSDGELRLSPGGRIFWPVPSARMHGSESAQPARDGLEMLVLRARSAPAAQPALGPKAGAWRRDGSEGAVRNGDHVVSVTGVFGLMPQQARTARAAGSGATGSLPPARFFILPTVAPVFTRDAPRPLRPGPVGGNLRVATANLDNDFATPADDPLGCAPRHTAADCRGPRNRAQSARQEARLVAELAGLDADVVALQELQNDGGATLGRLVRDLNRRSPSNPYAAVPAPASGLGHDAICVGLIYRSRRLLPAGAASTDTAAVHFRPPLAQVFQPADGGRPFAVIASHFKSRDCTHADHDDRDHGDAQGCWNARRTQQAIALNTFASSLRARTGVQDIILAGDFNAYAQEDPLRVLAAAGWTDVLPRFEPDAYTFVFHGMAGALDHVLASPSLIHRISGGTAWHINADEPAVSDRGASESRAVDPVDPDDPGSAAVWRASDHDPVLIGLEAAGR